MIEMVSDIDIKYAVNDVVSTVMITLDTIVERQPYTLQIPIETLLARLLA